MHHKSISLVRLYENNERMPSFSLTSSFTEIFLANTRTIFIALFAQSQGFSFVS